jgi:hypothetical protein
MIPLRLDRYSVLGDEWTVADNRFSADLVDGRDEQLLVFDENVRNRECNAYVRISAQDGSPETARMLLILRRWYVLFLAQYIAPQGARQPLTSGRRERSE